MKVNLDLEDIAKKVIHWGRFNRYLILEMQDIVRNSKRQSVLELGCGSGVTTSVLLENFERVVVVDGSAEYLKQNMERNSKYTNGTFIQSYFEELDLDEKFEDVVMSHILEHVEDPVHILKLAKQWAASDASFHIIVPNGFSVHRRIGVELGMLERPNDLPQSEADRGHRRVYDLDMLLEQISAAGLEVVSVVGCNIKLFTDGILQMLNQDYIDIIYRVSKEVDPTICSDLYVVAK
jgi:SAM-dependent methyltransferase